MSLIIPANSAAASGGFAVANSLRFHSNTYLTATFGSAPTLATKNTISLWFKRSELDGAQQLYATNSNAANIIINSIGSSNSSTIAFYTNSGQLLSPKVYRDVSAWMHIVFAFDSTQGTAANRLKVYINGVEETSFNNTAYPDQDVASELGVNGEAIKIGTRSNHDRIFEGYMAETAFVDGQALDATSFGEFDEDSGIWKPIDISGLTFGNNGFYLEYKQSGTGTNSSGMGADTSGNDLHFAVTNFTAIDQSTDTCTNNFATLNPIAFLNASGSLSEGNLRFDGVSSSAHNLGVGTIAVNKGKWWFEAEIDAYGGNNPSIGIASYDVNLTLSNYVGGITGTIGYTGNGNINENGSNLATGLNSYTDGDIINIGLDLDNNKIYVYKNGSLENSGGTTITNRLYTFAVSQNHTTGHWLTNFGNPTYTGTDQADGNSRGSFENAPPSGYYALCTKNLSEFG